MLFQALQILNQVAYGEVGRVALAVVAVLFPGLECFHVRRGDGFGPIAYLADASQEPTALLESRQRDRLSTDGITTALESLDDRSRRIVEERWLKVNDDGSGGMTLHDLAEVYGVSAERIRQIEVAAMKKMKKALAEYA